MQLLSCPGPEPKHCLNLQTLQCKVGGSQFISPDGICGHLQCYTHTSLQGADGKMHQQYSGSARECSLTGLF